jgi:hypothetical protein
VRSSLLSSILVFAIALPAVAQPAEPPPPAAPATAEPSAPAAPTPAEPSAPPAAPVPAEPAAPALEPALEPPAGSRAAQEPPPARPLPPAAHPLPRPAAAQPPAQRVILPPPRIQPVEDFEPPPRRHGPAGGPLLLGIGPSFVWRHDPGYDYVTEEKRAAGVELFASYDVLAPVPALVIAAGLDYRRIAGTSRDDDVGVVQHLLLADVTARLRLGPSWLSPHVRAGFGLAADRARLDDESGETLLEERDLGWAASFGGGLTVRTPLRMFETRGGKLSSLSFGLSAEAGYTLAPEAEFRRGRDRHAGIARAPLDLGGLERRAPYLRVALVTRF